MNQRLLIEFLWIIVNTYGAFAGFVSLRAVRQKAKEAYELSPTEIVKIVANQFYPFFVVLTVAQAMLALWGIYLMLYSTQTEVTPGFLVASAIAFLFPLMFDGAWLKYGYDQRQIKKIALTAPAAPEDIPMNQATVSESFAQKAGSWLEGVRLDVQTAAALSTSRPGPPPDFVWRLPAIVEAWNSDEDGDTIVMTIWFSRDLPIANVPVRAQSINAIEKSKKFGSEATAAAKALLPEGTRVTLLHTRLDKYAKRFLAHIILPDGSEFAEHMLAAMASDGVTHLADPFMT